MNQVKAIFNTIKRELHGVWPALALLAVCFAAVRYGAAGVEWAGQTFAKQPGWGEKFKALFRA